MLKTFIYCSFALFPFSLVACSDSSVEKLGDATVIKSKDTTVITTDKDTIVIDNEKLDEKRKQRVEKQKEVGKVSAF